MKPVRSVLLATGVIGYPFLTFFSERNETELQHRISLVIESWEELRRIPNYEEKAGVILFKQLFLDCQPAKVLFGFPANVDVESSEVLESKRFKMHAAYMIQMLDTALNMLGKSSQLITLDGVCTLGSNVLASDFCFFLQALIPSF
jgi:hypothetical protein